MSDTAAAGGTQDDRILPDRLTDGSVPDPDLATEEGQLGTPDEDDTEDAED